jgi:hypothetical protein
MKSHSVVSSWICLVIFLLGVAACGAGTEAYGRKIVGGVEVKEDVRGPFPQRMPRTIYVADFALDVDDLAAEEGVRGALPGRLGQRLPHLFAKGNPSERVRQIVESMAESLVQGLRAKDVTAQRLRNIAGNLPPEGWLVQGHFTEVDEGNRLKRAGIGFGKGATSMDVQVGISDLTSPDPRAAFAFFGTVKDPSRIPGAVVAMNPYVAAAKFVLQKNATERDIKRTADQIAEQILKYEEEIKEKAQSESR